MLVELMKQQGWQQIKQQKMAQIRTTGQLKEATRIENTTYQQKGMSHARYDPGPLDWEQSKQTMMLSSQQSASELHAFQRGVHSSTDVRSRSQ